MSSKNEEGSLANEKNTSKAKTSATNTDAIAAASAKDAKRSDGTEASRGSGATRKSKSAKSRKNSKAKALGPTKTAAGEKNPSVGNKSVATQVDIRVWVKDKDLLKEKSKETFWRKVAESNQATITELRDDNVKLHATIDYLSRENVRYQQIIKDQQNQFQGANDGAVPALPTVFDEDEEPTVEENACGPSL